MNSVPDEIILNIITFLRIPDIVNLQRISRRFFKIARDNGLWKSICWEESSARVILKRQMLYAKMSGDLHNLVKAAEILQDDQILPLKDSSSQPRSTESRLKRNFSNWDPVYSNEQIDFYEEYIQRHGPISPLWLNQPRRSVRKNYQFTEAIGIGLVYQYEGSVADRVFSPMEDGSIQVWRVPRPGERGRSSAAELLLKSKGELLTDLNEPTDGLQRRNRAKVETGAVDCVAVDSASQKVFIGVHNMLSEVDLNTMQVSRRSPYPFAITALSEARFPTPLTVGTNWTIHLHDRRLRGIGSCGVIDTSYTLSQLDLTPKNQRWFGRSHSSLTQPGPLSIVHTPYDQPKFGNGDIWVAGRFTSVLNYDSRSFPRLFGTFHSGAKISSMIMEPQPYIPRNLRTSGNPADAVQIQKIKSEPGSTIISAGEYKGKGALELYGLALDSERSITSPGGRSTRVDSQYQNRQSASSTRLLSVATHGTRIVFSDGDGNIKWVERDGFTPVRQFNITANSDSSESTPSLLENRNRTSVGSGDADFGDDIVQKILPQVSSQASTRRGEVLGDNSLFIWTGNGRLGMLRFGNDEAESVNNLEKEAQDAKEMEQFKQERAYNGEMRHALERHAAELRFVRGLGFGLNR